jgi:hypothetical protein
MPTLESRIEASILKAFDDQAKSSNNPDDPSLSRKKIASAIAKVVVVEIKAATIIIVGTSGNVPLTITSVTIT